MANGIEPILLTPEQAQRVIDSHYGTSTPIASLEEFELHGYSAFTPTKSYMLSTEDGTAYILKVARPPSLENDNSTYAPNTLSSEYELLTLLEKHTDVPHAAAHRLDTSLALIPYVYLLLSAPRGIPLAHARASGRLTPRQALQLDLRVGAHLRSVHERVQNDWFGLPAQARDALYSWQEAFTGVLEGLLHEARALLGGALPYDDADVRRCLSRAIGFFLFDDCEVPSLVSLAGDDASVMVDFDPEAPLQEDEVPITSLLPLSHALWGDPLFEAMFINPSAAFLEGYGGSPVVFARQKTKRLWYTFFLALVIIVQTTRPEDIKAETADRQKKVDWAREELASCVEKLKNAPCY